MASAFNITILRKGRLWISVVKHTPSVRIVNFLTIPAGGITALVGPNGAGKRLLLLTMIGRLLDIDEGVIEVGGLNVTTKSAELARTLSILGQENHYISA